METEENIKKYLPLVKKNILSLSLGFLGLMFLSYGMIVLIGGGKSSSDEIIFESGKDQETEIASLSSRQVIKSIVVDVGGGVIKPGVYNVSYNARIQDALVAASGLSESADRGWVSKNLNLAQKLVDGAKVYIPKTGENIKEGVGVGLGIENLLKAQINVNTASIKELDSLPGVGMITAQKIIDNRPYTAIDELLLRKAVNAGVFEKIKEKITVY